MVGLMGCGRRFVQQLLVVTEQQFLVVFPFFHS